MKRNKTKALIDLLDDEDRHVSTLAMEQLLQMDTELDHLVAEYQESHNPVLRGRIHQLGSILQLRRDRASFIENVKNQSISLWDGIVQINYHFNPQLRLQDVTETMEDIIGRLPANPSTVKLAAFMRNENFSYTGEDILGPDLFLIEDVLVQRVGSPVILAALAHQLGAVAGWQSSIALYKGKHCLVDADHNLIEPGERWRVGRLTREDKLHPCTDRDIWLTILSQLFLSALLDGRLQAIHRAGTLLATLCDGDFRDLPFPLGS